MRQRIFDDSDKCPCRVKKDMEESKNVYAFLEEFYGDMETYNWGKYDLVDIECAYCLVKSALKIVKSDKQKYSACKVCSLVSAKNSITEVFLEKALNRIRHFLDHL